MERRKEDGKKKRKGGRERKKPEAVYISPYPHIPIQTYLDGHKQKIHAIGDAPNINRELSL